MNFSTDRFMSTDDGVIAPKVRKMSVLGSSSGGGSPSISKPSGAAERGGGSPDGVTGKGTSEVFVRSLGLIPLPRKKDEKEMNVEEMTMKFRL